MAELFQTLGTETVVVDPSELEMSKRGVFFCNRPIDLIYNRHCDFYLEGAELAGLRAAYLARQVCLTPNPRAYGLLADKRRMTCWSDRHCLELLGLEPKVQHLLLNLIPTTKLLSTMGKERVWSERKQWVMKPATGSGSRGVLLGKSVSRKRYNELDDMTTLVQEWIPPSHTEPILPEVEGMKIDIRLFVYRHRLLGVGARVYRGQVTNLRNGGGFAPVRIK